MGYVSKLDSGPFSQSWTTVAFSSRTLLMEFQKPACLASAVREYVHRSVTLPSPRNFCKETSATISFLHSLINKNLMLHIMLINATLIYNSLTFLPSEELLHWHFLKHKPKPELVCIQRPTKWTYVKPRGAWYRGFIGNYQAKTQDIITDSTETWKLFTIITLLRVIRRLILIWQELIKTLRSMDVIADVESS